MNTNRSRDLQRRDVLKLLGGGTVAVLAVGVSKVTTASTAPPSSDPSTATTSGSDAGVCAVIPEETAGPFPGDGSNGPNVLIDPDAVRRDITSSFGGATGVAEGVPLEINLVITDTANGCAPLEGAAVYVWHCDREGRYSIYSDGVEDENYLRGVQETDADGTVVFDSIFPGAYRGRWPHVHFAVYSSLDEATGGGEPLATSQIAFPQDICEVVYATEGYEVSIGNLDGLSLEDDIVFADDDGVSQLATMSGDVEEGLTAELAVGTEASR